jgi:hypothetical protein
MGASLRSTSIVIAGESGGKPHSALLPMFRMIAYGTGALVGYIASHRWLQAVICQS